MNDAFHAAASTLAAVQRLLEVATSNAVNGQTPGYVNRVLTIRSFATELDEALGRDATFVTTQEAPAFQQGTLVDAPSPLAVALTGPGFLVVQTPGGPAYTRNGDLTLAPDGRLVTRAGYDVLGTSGPLRADPNGAQVRLGEGGALFQGDEVIGALKVVEFDRPELLERVSETMFRAPGEAGERPAIETQAHPGQLELPAQRTVAGMVGLIAASREYEAAQRVTSVINRSYERLLSRQ